tara:strand:+ start:252 stop:635 length:384 start_codon:yes stop_codon:yes gene_type:complete
MNFKKLLILINIIFFIYFSIELLVFTDEFALENIGFFNHAVAGLAEIIGIIFLSFSLSLCVILFRETKNQFPFFLSIFLLQFVIAVNFWRYILTNSPGETNIETIMFNAVLFSLVSIATLYLLIKRD